MNKYTDLLYARPAFLGGLSRVLDLGGTLSVYNDAATPREADRDALRSDWYAIGNDLRGAMLAYGERLRRDDPDGRRS